MLQMPVTKLIGNMAVSVEPYIWKCIEEIAQNEEIDVPSIVRMTRERLKDRQAKHDDVRDLAGAVSSAMRVLAVSYFRRDASYSRIADALNVLGQSRAEGGGAASRRRIRM